MKKYKIFYIIGIAVLLISVTLFLCFYLFDSKHIEDSNGSLTNLETILIEDMITSKDHYVASFSSSTYSGNTTGVKDKFKDADHDYIRFSAGKFSGIQTLQSSKLKSNQKLTIVVESKLLNGNLEIIIVDPNNTLVATINVNAKETIDINNTIEGVYRVVVGGESAELKIEINRIIK